MFKKKWPWMILFLLIAVISIWAVISQSKSFSFSDLKVQLAQANPFWLALAILAALLTIYLEGLALSILIKHLTGLNRFKRGFIYSSADVYFSAITPSATGGQPASAVFMVWDGVSLGSTTVVLLTNEVFYIGSMLLLSLIIFPFETGLFFQQPVFSQILIFCGAAIVILLVSASTLLLLKDKIIGSVIRKLIQIGSKLHIVKHPEKQLSSLEATMEQYRECTKALRGKEKTLWLVLLVNMLLRIMQNAITPLCYLALGGKMENAFSVFCLQVNTSLAGHAVPIPGGMGAADYILVNGLDLIQDVTNAANLELVCRGISFYGCVLLACVIVAVAYIRMTLLKKKNGSQDKN